MAQKQILTYPWGVKYKKDGWNDQVKNYTNGADSSGPCSTDIYEGKSIVTTNGEEWWGDGTGNTAYSWSDANNNPFNQNWGGSSQKGLHYWLQTSSNGYQKARWFDIGGDGGENHGAYVYSYTSSTWLSEVTALWFLFNGHDTTESRGCYAYVEKAALRYRDPNGRIAIHTVTEKLGELSINEGVRGGTKQMFGYALPSSLRNTICISDYRFLGIRVQIKLRRDGSGTSTDTLQGGISGFRLGLGTNPTAPYNETNKRALVGKNNESWTYFNPYRVDMDTR